MNVGFVGFGEVNTPIDIIIRKCTQAERELKDNGLDLVSVFPVTDDREEKDIQKAINALSKEKIEALVICIAGWIPTHAVIKVTEHFRHLPMALWGLCGWMEGTRLVTTADQAGTTALRKTFADMGYTFHYFYDIIGKASRSASVADYIRAALAAEEIRHQKAGMMGYRDMQLYGTLYDGASLKREIGPEIETFEMLEVFQRYEKITDSEKEAVIENAMKDWKFVKPAQKEGLMKAAGYYLALRDIIKERNYKAISLKDVDGMKQLLGFPPAPIFMLIANEIGIPTVPENDSLGCITQMMIRALTGQIAAYLEFYEFFEDSVLAGVPDYVPAEITDGDITVMPAAFGELSEGILNVSKVKEGPLTMCRLFCENGKYTMHLVKGEGKSPMQWEEAGWTQPAPQLPGLRIEMKDVPHFAENVMCQHYIIAYGDHVEKIKYLCEILHIDVLESGAEK